MFPLALLFGLFKCVVVCRCNCLNLIIRLHFLSNDESRYCKCPSYLVSIEFRRELLLCNLFFDFEMAVITWDDLTFFSLLSWEFLLSWRISASLILAFLNWEFTSIILQCNSIIRFSLSILSCAFLSLFIKYFHFFILQFLLVPRTISLLILHQQLAFLSFGFNFLLEDFNKERFLFI